MATPKDVAGCHRASPVGRCEFTPTDIALIRIDEPTMLTADSAVVVYNVAITTGTTPAVARPVMDQWVAWLRRDGRDWVVTRVLVGVMGQS